jgi:hypothetical protein
MFTKISMGSTFYSTIEKSIFFEPMKSFEIILVLTFVEVLNLQVLKRVTLPKYNFLSALVLSLD